MPAYVRSSRNCSVIALVAALKRFPRTSFSLGWKKPNRSRRMVSKRRKRHQRICARHALPNGERTGVRFQLTCRASR